MSWEKVKLGDVIIELASGGRPKGGAVDLGIPSLGAEHLSDDGAFNFSKVKYVPAEYFKTMKKGVVSRNDILIVKDGATTGKVSFVNGSFPFEKASINEHLFQIKVDNQKIEPKYLFYFLYSSEGQKQILSDFRGATVGGISREILDKVIFPLPPLPIQQKIAAILDQADALRKKDRQLLAKYDELLQAVFYDMFGDPVKNEKGWEKKKLKNVCKQITDGTHFSPPSVEKGIPYITAKHIKRDGVDFFSAPTYVSKEHHLEIYKRCTPNKGDVLYIKDGATTGIAAINEYDFEFSMLSSLALIKPDFAKLNNYYLVQWLNNSSVTDFYIRTYMAGAAIKRFTLQKINSFELLVPPIGLQTEFANITSNIQKQKHQIKKQLEKSENLFQSLLQRAFKGELVKE